MKRFLKYLLPALPFIFFTTSANADPITQAVIYIAAIVAESLTVAAAVKAVIVLALSTGLSYLQQAISGKKESEGAGQKIQAGGVLPRSFIVGSYETPGKLVYVNTWGNANDTPNAMLTMVIALSDIPITSITGLWVSEKHATYGSGVLGSKGYAIPEFNSGGDDYMWVKFYDGTQTVADSFLTGLFGSDPNYPYESTRVGTGVAYAIVTMLDSDYLFPTVPNIKFEINGIKLYDQRLDSTNGGSGGHRPDTPATWEFTNNPVVILNNILRGITYDGEWMFGLQSISSARLPSDSWFAAANECDALISKNGGGTESTYRCGLEIPVSAQAADVIDELLKACNGRLAEIGGTYKINVGAAGSSIYAFTDDDIVITEQQSYTPFPGQTSLINGITASFPDPNQGWAQTDVPARYDADLEAEDGNRFVVNVDYNAVPYLEQVQRLMTSAVQESRKFRRHTIVLPPECWILEPNDIITYTSERNGYEDKLFRVDGVTDNANLDIVAVITECDPADYDWDTATDFIPKVDGILVQAPVPTSQPIYLWAVTNTIVLGDDGRQKAAIQLSWDTNATDIEAVQFQIRLAADNDVIWDGQVSNWQSGSLIVSENVLSNTAYEARGKYIPHSDRPTEWSSWLTVTTDDIKIDTIDIADEAINLDKLHSDVTSILDQVPTIGEALENSDKVLRSLVQDVQEAGNALLSLQSLIPDVQEAANSAVAVARTELTTNIEEGLRAEAQARTDLAAIVTGLIGNDDSIALAARVTDLETATADLEAQKAEASDLEVLDAQINTPSTGLAAQVSTLESTVSALDPDGASAKLVQTAIAARVSGMDIEALGDTLIQILSNLDKLNRDTTSSIAYYRNEIVTQVTQGLSASAVATGELGVRLQTDVATLTGSISTEASVRASADAVLTSVTNSLTAALTGYTGSSAVATAFTTLSGRVTTAEGLITSQGLAITALQSTVNNPSTGVAATASALSSLSTAVNHATTGLANTYTIASAGATAITNLQSTLTGYNPSSTVANAISSLTTSVSGKAATFAQTSTPTATAVGDLWIDTDDSNKLYRWNGSSWAVVDNALISSHSSAILALENTVDDPSTGVAATSTALSTLNSQVQHGTTGLAATNAIATQADTRVGNFYASGLFRVATTTTASGADASITLQVAASSGGSPYTAAIYMDAMSGGTTRIRMLASQFSFTDGSTNTTPFSYSGGTLYIDTATIANLTVDNLTANAVNWWEAKGFSAGDSVSYFAFGDKTWNTTAYRSSTRVFRSTSIVRIEMRGGLVVSGAGSPTGDLRCYRSDGSIINSAYGPATPASPLGPAGYFVWIDSAPLGTSSYYELRTHYTVGTGGGPWQVDISSTWILFTEIKA